MKSVSCLFLCLAFAAPAFAGVVVGSPGSGQVDTPFALSAYATDCSSQPIAAMAYSIDSGADVQIVYAGSINANVAASPGAHTLHVKAWGNQGAVCVSDVAVNVTNGGNSPVPANATAVSNLQALNNWRGVYDNVTGGWAAGSTQIVGSPSRSGAARAFTTRYGNSGGVRYYASFGDDTSSTNFFYDAWVNIAFSPGQIANLEVDMNQVMANGQTVIFGVQCDGYTGTWDYTANTGTPQRPVDTWVHSQAPCKADSWGKSEWHHIQFSYSRNDAGVVTYKSIWLDGHESDLNATVPSAFALGWAPTLLTNFQVDGLGSGGSATVYLDNLTVYRW